MEKTYISKCHKVEVKNYEEGIVLNVCDYCHKECEVEEVCAECLGTGEVSTMEAVYAGEPHMADIGTRKCICQSNDDDYDDQQ